MSVALQFKLTQVGQAAVWNSTNTGLSLNLTHIQFGSGRRVPTGTELALLQPQQAVPIAAGFSVSRTQIRMSAIFGGAQNYAIAEIGLWAGDPAVAGAKLIGYFSQDATDLAFKSAGVDFIFAHDMKLDAAVPAGSLTILADASQSAMLAMITVHESAADPHPQYVLKTTFQNAGRLPSGAALPTSDIGPIWHDDYGSFMVWQSFTGNGANYIGYASTSIGGLLLDTQPTARKGYVKSGTANLSRVAYAALRHWAIHHGLMIASASWVAGSLLYKDNGDGTTFTVADVRGEFPRFWDDARGVDAARGFGSAQLGTPVRVKSQYPNNYIFSALKLSAGYYDAYQGFGVSNAQEVYPSGFSYYGYAIDDSSTYGNMRPRNTSFLASIKF